MRINSVLVFVLFSTSLLAQRLDFNLDYPAQANSFSGMVSANIQYNLHLKRSTNFMGLGSSALLLNNIQNQQILNYNIDVGVNKEIAIHPSVNIYPYLNIGYARFQYSNNSNNGIKGEAGVSICHTSIKPWVGLDLAYRQYAMKGFNFSPKVEAMPGTFGVFLIGLHAHLHR